MAGVELGHPAQGRADPQDKPRDPGRTARCRNCDEPLSEPRPNFCGHCGQETTLAPPTIGEFLHQFGGNYVALEGTLWRTLRLLLFRPGELTRQYWIGRKRQYVLPVRLYLTISLIALALMRWTSPLQVPSPEQLAAVKAEAIAEAKVAIAEARADGKAGPVVNVEIGENGKFACNRLPDWVCTRLKERYDLDSKLLAAEMRRLQDRFLSHWGSAMFVLVPAFAAWLTLLYRNRQQRYAEHLVFALHLHAFWFALFAANSLLPEAAAAAAGLVAPAYATVAARRAYGGRWWITVLRMSALSFLYGGTLLAALVGVAVWALLE